MKRSEFRSIVALSFEKERINLGYTQQEMATALDLSLQAYKRIISQEVDKIDSYALYRFYEFTGRNIIHEHSMVCDIIDRFKSLSAQQQQFVKTIVDFEADFRNDDNISEISVLIPSIEAEDGMIWDSVNIEKQSVPIRENVTCGIRITSNHLHPVYIKGDTLLISRRPIHDGDIGIFINKKTGRAYIRKFLHTQPCILEPINGYGEIFYVDSSSAEDMEQWIKFGVVVSKVR